jgi:ABC-type Mn2+/Zn2+ transport system permease subunit
VGAVVAVSCIWLASRQRAVGPDAAVAVSVTALFGLGAVLALEPEVPARLGEILFGDLLAVSTGDLVASGLVAAGLIAGLLALHRRLSLVAFDPVTAPVLGARRGTVELVLLALVAIAVVTAARTLGNLLAIALLVAPALAASRLTTRLAPSLVAAAGLAAAAGVGGLYASYYLDLAAGASVALAALATLLVPSLVRRGTASGRANRSPVDAVRGTS